MKFRLSLIWSLVQLCFKWPLVIALGDPELQQTIDAGISIAWRNLWLPDSELTMTIDEADVVYLAALRNGHRAEAQQLLDAVESGKFQ
jgi:hypothetical protein